MTKRTVIVLLAAICVGIAGSAEMAVASPLAFSFDCMAEADAYATLYGSTDTVHTGPVASHAFAFAMVSTAYAAADISGGTNADGALIRSFLYASAHLGGSATSSASLIGTFSVLAAGNVSLTAQAQVVDSEMASGNAGGWSLRVWDLDNPAVSLLELDASSLVQEVTLTGGETYGIGLAHPGGINETNYEVYVQLSAIPEPATMSLLAMGGMVMLRRRKS